MKKLLQKGNKEKDEKKKDKKEKKEKKEKSKKSKKDKHSASTSSLDKVPDSPVQTSHSTTVVTKTTITSDSPGGETKTTVVKETVRKGQGERASETTVEEKSGGDSSGEKIVKKTTTTTVTKSEPDEPVETKTVVKETRNVTPQGEERVVVTKTTSEVQSSPSIQPTETKTVVKETRNVTPQGEERVVVTKTTSEVESSPSIQPAETKTVVKETRNVTPQGKERVVVTKTTSEVQSSPSIQPAETKTVVKETRNVTPQGEETVVVTKTTSEVESTPSIQPAETKTVVKETRNVTPKGEETVVVTKTTSEVQSAPTTREFLMENFPETARLETTRLIQQRVISQDVSPSTDQPTHVSERTIIRQVNDGGKTIKTVTKVVSDDGGITQTTTTTSSGQPNEDEKENADEGEKVIVSKDVERKADLPEWLEHIQDTSTPKGEVKIDDSIEIPSPHLQRKGEEKAKLTGPKVVEEVHSIEDKKENSMDLLDDLENVGKEQAKEEKNKPEPPAEIPFTYEPKKPEKRVYTGDPVTENVDNLKSASKAEAEVDFSRLEKTPEAKPKHTERTVQQTHTRKIISNNGETVETVTKTTTDEDGRVRTTETKTISGGKEDKPKQAFDVNYNIKDSEIPKTSPKMSKRNLQEDIAKKEKNVIEDVVDNDDDDREILEEIIVVEKKRKVRFPKSFVPYERQRPKAVLPFDLLLVERPQRSPRKLPPVGKRVDENVEEAEPQIRKSEIPDLDELDRLLDEYQAVQQDK